MTTGRNSAANLRSASSSEATASVSSTSGAMRRISSARSPGSWKASSALGGGRTRSITATVAVVPSWASAGRSARRSRMRWMTVVWPPDAIPGDYSIPRAKYPHLLRSHYDCSMEAPGITRHRRPFLAPLWLTLLALLVAAVIAYTVYRDATMTVVVLASWGAKEPGTIDDPPISAEGEQRAERLARMFGQAAGPGRLDALYSSGERRAQQTVAPLADLLHLSPTVYDAREAATVTGNLLRSHEGGSILVVGGSA